MSWSRLAQQQIYWLCQRIEMKYPSEKENDQTNEQISTVLHVFRSILHQFSEIFIPSRRDAVEKDKRKHSATCFEGDAMVWGDRSVGGKRFDVQGKSRHHTLTLCSLSQLPSPVTSESFHPSQWHTYVVYIKNCVIHRCARCHETLNSFTITIYADAQHKAHLCTMKFASKMHFHSRSLSFSFSLCVWQEQSEKESGTFIIFFPQLFPHRSNECQMERRKFSK